MPYVCCPRCALRTYSAAYWLGADHCARCDAELPRLRRFAPSRSRVEAPSRARDGTAAAVDYLLAGDRGYPAALRTNGGAP